jgi:prepilin-type N-terminal cleavage/methylation domain-containing protein
MVLVEKSGSANQHGFTLIEIIASLVILGMLSSVAVHRYYMIEVNAEKKVLSGAIQELNTREMLRWLQVKLSLNGYPGDELLFGAINKDIGPQYSWDSGPSLDGGTLHFGSQYLILHRMPSDSGAPGRWQ